MRRLAGLISLLLASTLWSVPVLSQARPPVIEPAPAGHLQRVTLRDGSELVGRITSVSDTSVQFESALGVTTIPIASITGVASERPGEVRAGQYFFANPNDTRLVFGPTGRQLPRGSGYFSDYWLFFPGLAVGLTDRVTIGGGMSVFPETGPGGQLFYVTPKVGVVQGKRFNAAVGALALTVPDDEGNNTAGVLYGVGTWGQPNASVTAGLGYGFVNGRLAHNPALMVGGEARASPGISFVSENYLFPGNFSALSAGVRFMGRKLSVDLAFFSFSGAGESVCCLPFLGFVWKWN